jgi:hypothetical protein
MGEPGSTTIADLLAFIDSLPEISNRPLKTIANYRMGVRSVRQALSLDDAFDLGRCDIDEVIERYESAVAGRLTPGTASTYGYNFRHVTRRFLLWVEKDAAWDGGDKKFAARSERASRVAGDGIRVYQFPLRATMTIALTLPTDLTAGEAERLARFVTTLAVES